MKPLCISLGLLNAILVGGMLLPAMAQVTSDATTKTIVNTSGSNYTIINGIEKGNNLFHSFSNFSVPTGGSATFDLVNTPNITNIFSRVTGANVSNIDGLIRTVNSTNPVSLFLMNPSGIVFGKNAVLNIGGSFVGTTASSIKFSDGSEFRAVNSGTTPLLTVSVPIGLQMGSAASQIQVQGKGNDGIVPTNNLGIIASPGKTFALVGGGITFTGGVITAPMGRIEVGAVGSGTVSLTPTPTGWQLGYAQVADFGSINFTQGSSLWNPYPMGNPFGGIQVVGKDITLNQSQIAAATAGTQQGGDITVNAARSLYLGGVNANAQAPSAWIVNQVAPGATGNGGAVNIQTGQLTLKDGAGIETLSLGAGAAGKVQVQADTITVTGAIASKSPLAFSGSSTSRIASETYGSGNGGDVTVAAGKLTLDDSGIVGTTVFPGATGKGGNILVDVADEIKATGVSPVSLTASGINAYSFGIGNSGNVRVNAGSLNFLDGGTIYTFTSRLAGIPGTGIGNGGDVTVVAREGINIVGTSPISPTLTSSIGSFTTGFGNSGNLSVTTPLLSMQDGATLTTITVPLIGSFGDPSRSNYLGNSGNISLNVGERLTISGINEFTLVSTFVGSATYSKGKAGDVTIQTNQLQVLDAGAIANITGGAGDAGALTIRANDILVEGKNINTSAIGAGAPIPVEAARQFYGLPKAPTGNIGVLNIDTHQLTVRDGGRVTVTHEGTGSAGHLNIEADSIWLDTGNISATTASGKGGNINLVVKNSLVSRHGSKITAEVGGSGDGGNITISVPVIVGLENSDIIANAVNGNGGNIQISTQGIFGLEPRNQLTPESDITASSQFGVNGTVDIHNFGVDPSSGLVILPTNVTDSSQQIAAGCSNTNASRFVATGRGGVPQNPVQEVRSDNTWFDTRDISAFGKNSPVSVQIPSSSEVLVQATSWHRNAEGKIELVAEKSPTQMQQLSLTCAAVRQR
ncbi:S-layer family protein [Aetokthonos hydrillicola Thurmond2011]|jgi:filamentous hemagglutinin family protein|uniref:S-layer family protein n=1 Tax=Aetokthonos hydrillicola Thurmond2011 TaxID=2712845 RepID=A0AAP5M9F6_9CYAN|nr:S-layer family protein [Aetokthonos hydrillicola]MBO3457681.1 S-layer family protein [Aetokthonos hydrillicola CCALA 1050]MBW4587960.1 S-layer family protein [Aetokthonos hydrillicola CCALA 1050]MDR9894633.1 S-layer family protein [Aetokthonos hydrillicola Thurmond2011]